MNRRLGMDLWSVAIHAFVTITAAAALGEAVGSANNLDDVVIPATLGVGAIVFERRRRRALAALPPAGLTTGEVHQERLDEMEARLAEVDLLHARVAELEERLDFSERLLARVEGGQFAERPGEPR